MTLATVRVTALFVAAGLLEIGGGYLVWLWFRERRAPLVVGMLGFVLLACYGILPTLQPREHPFGRVYAAYGAVFIVLSVCWGWGVDRQAPDVRDWVGMTLALAGAIVMMLPRALR